MTKEETFEALREIVSTSRERTMIQTDWWHDYGTDPSVLLPSQYDYIYYPLFYLTYDIYTWGDLLEFLNTYNKNGVISVPHVVNRSTAGVHTLKVRSGVTISDPAVSVEVRLDGDASGNPLNLPLTIQKIHRDTIYDKAYKFIVRETHVIDINGPEWLTRVNDYRYVPNQYTFLGGSKTTQMYFGLELEISTKLSPAELYYVVTQVEPKQEPFFYCKHDGSINGAYGIGFEIVTLPCTPRYLKNAFRVFMKKLERITSNKVGDFIDLNDPASTGLHIHVSKSSFRTQKSYEKLWMNKFSTIWNQWDTQNSEFLQRLSRRKISLLDNDYCSPHSKMRGRTLATRLNQGAFCIDHRDRYASARETNSTVEVRVFQGSFNIDHILYCIELTQAIHEYSRQMSIKDIGRNFKNSFTNWLTNQSGYRYAKQGVFQCV